MTAARKIEATLRANALGVAVQSSPIETPSERIMLTDAIEDADEKLTTFKRWERKNVRNQRKGNRNQKSSFALEANHLGYGTVTFIIPATNERAVFSAWQHRAM